ncbi:hypothetical protein CJ030_MR0G002164 [Morella rubra]|uniref:Uncharacterized protein n=1 Tax=Morella rubra TaxID=262757 RepID=A0A6A1UN67_9ROSI|nr:hypothetical protein CJ030_MR0G002164 [Morella rubra]
MTSTMNTTYRTHRNRMFQHYSVFNSKEEALEHPYPDLNKEELTCVCDLFASEEFQKNPESDEISTVLLYKKTHTNKDGMWTLEDARENFEKMEALQLQYESEESHTPKWRFSLRCWGRKRVTCEVGEARLQIEEMRARQLEYEALLVKWSDMEQTMREQLMAE